MKKMNLNRLLLPLLVGVSLHIAGAEDIPKSFTIARYQPMMARSPFAVATAVAAPAATPNFAKDLYISSAMHSKDEDMVTMSSSTDKTFKKYLSSKAPVDGYSIVGIDWSEKVGATKVTISKDGSIATIGFNEALLRQPGQNAPPPPGKEGAQPQAPAQAAVPVVPGAPPPPNAQPNAIKPMPVPVLPTTQPARVRGVIPRNPAANGQVPSNAAVPPANTVLSPNAVPQVQQPNPEKN
jgi:hypothetical protein